MGMLMKTNANLMLAAFFFLLAAAPAAGQQPSPAAQLEAMKKLNFLIGKWEGESWTEFAPGQRLQSHGTETVQDKLGGLLVTMEGIHRRKAGEKNEGTVVHNAFGVATFDEKAKRYRFQAYTNRGTYVDAEAKIADGRFEWGFRVPNAVEIRYVIKLNDKGQWFETGEMSRDGKTWRKFFEMTLDRVKNPPPA